MSLHRVLKEARALISDKEAWTKGAMARDKYGDIVYASSPNAVCFCAAGAVEQVSGDPDIFHAAIAQLNAVVKEQYPELSFESFEKGLPCITVVNDTPETTHEDILKFFDAAIALLGDQEEEEYFARPEKRFVVTLTNIRWTGEPLDYARVDVPLPTELRFETKFRSWRVAVCWAISQAMDGPRLGWGIERCDETVEFDDKKFRVHRSEEIPLGWLEEIATEDDR